MNLVVTTHYPRLSFILAVFETDLEIPICKTFIEKPPLYVDTLPVGTAALGTYICRSRYICLYVSHSFIYYLYWANTRLKTSVFI